MLPLTRPALATLGILTFLGSWNNFLWPLVVAQTEEKYTLPVALALYSTGQNAQHYGLLMAGAVVVVVPVLVSSWPSSATSPRASPPPASSNHRRLR